MFLKEDERKDLFLMVMMFAYLYINIVHFTNRQDQKRPVKKLVQPTVVPPLTEEGSTMQGGTDSENPVATAAAIAAAAASAATGPFLQVISHNSKE